MCTKAEGVDALLRQIARRIGVWRLTASSQAKTSERCALTALSSRRTSACHRDSTRERVRIRPYPGRCRSCSTCEVASSLQQDTRGGQSCRARKPARRTSSVPPRQRFLVARFLSTPREGESLRSLARAEARHAARLTRRRSHPSEERGCLPPCGRANVPHGGRKRRSYVLPPCTGKVVGSLG